MDENSTIRINQPTEIVPPINFDDLSKKELIFSGRVASVTQLDNDENSRYYNKTRNNQGIQIKRGTV